MIGDLPAECPLKCGEKITRDGLIIHQEKCSQREYQCPIKDCDFIGIKTELTKHSGEAHINDVFEALQSFAAKSVKGVNKNVQGLHRKVYDCPFAACVQDAVMERNMLCKHIYQNHHKEKEWFNQVFHSGRGPIEIINSEGRFANMSPNGKFYCGVEEGSYEPQKEKEQNHFGQRIPCTIDSGLNCWSCMKLDVTMRNLPYGSLVNGAGHVSTPNFCTHDVKDSEYFAQNYGRSALCTYRNCKVTPKFSCQMATKPICSNDARCKDCEALCFPFRLRWTAAGENKGDDIEYYKPVWEK